MALCIYNSLTNRKERFIPVQEGHVNMYVCGMTVYSDAHIGHARTYLSFDIIRRYLQHCGYEVIYVQNVTDVDDKIINAANEQGRDPLEYSQAFTDRCLDDLDDMGIRRADIYPKASDSIPDMIQLIEDIMSNGFAYQSGGDVYFDVPAYHAHYHEYGILSGQNPDELRSGARITDHDKKRSPLDFALWKGVKPGEPSWPSPWGNGRPGWHIECSAMSRCELGLPFDIHGGGMDLQFPHHENEIAQARAGTGKEFAHYWMHSGLLTVGGTKMSKSLGNFITVKDAIGQYGAELLRIFFAQAHYRSPPDFSPKNLEDIKKGLNRIHRFEERLIKMAGSLVPHIPVDATDSEQIYLDLIKRLKQDFESAMEDDINTPKAFAVIYEFINDCNRHFDSNPSLLPELHAHSLRVLRELGHILTLFQEDSIVEDAADVLALKDLLLSLDPGSEVASEEEIMARLLQLRTQARKNKDWGMADSIRDGLTRLGYEIQDTAEGPVWRKS